MEIEKEKRIFFLDVLITRKEDNLITCRVYRKNTQTRTYLHENSHHFPPHKNGVISTLVTIALRILDNEHLEKK